jgi:hypothetical protein
MDCDPIPDIQKLGYTFREASFLYLVGIHSGYFLRRQFNRNIQRELGALSQQFLEKADGLGHVRTLEYRQKRYVFHLTSKPFYYLLSDEIPPYQHLQRDERIKTQLMILDYVLDHPDTRFLPRPSDKLRFFGDTLRLSRELLPQKVFSGAGQSTTPSYFAEPYPVAVLPGFAGQHPLISFAFVDAGNQTLKPFRAYLVQYAPLLQSLSRFEIVYVSDSTRNSTGAARLFYEMMDGTRGGFTSEACPRDVNHFLLYLRARRLFEENREPLSLEQYQLLREGEATYTENQYEQIYAAWKRGRVTSSELRARYQPKPVEASIRGYLMKASYPFCAPKYQGVAL